MQRLFLCFKMFWGICNSFISTWSLICMQCLIMFQIINSHITSKLARDTCRAHHDNAAQWYNNNAAQRDLGAVTVQCVFLYLLDGRWSVSCQWARERQHRVEVELHHSRDALGKVGNTRTMIPAAAAAARGEGKPDRNTESVKAQMTADEGRRRRVRIEASSVCSLSYWLTLRNIYTLLMEGLEILKKQWGNSFDSFI